MIALLPAAGALQYWAAGATDTVERVFSRSFYPGLVGVLSCLTGWLPFSVGEAALLVFSALAALWLVRLGWWALRRKLSLAEALGRSGLAPRLPLCRDRRPHQQGDQNEQNSVHCPGSMQVACTPWPKKICLIS